MDIYPGPEGGEWIVGGDGAQRIVILGNAGSGKSTLARDLGRRLDLPVVHMDLLFWGPQWTQPDDEAFRERVRSSVSGDRWISEGNYARRTLDLRLARADLVIWLDTPRMVCLYRVARRSIFARSRPDLPTGCREQLDAEFLAFLRYVWAFDREARPGIDAARRACGPHVPVLRLRGRPHVASILDDLPESLDRATTA